MPTVVETVAPAAEQPATAKPETRPTAEIASENRRDDLSGALVQLETAVGKNHEGEIRSAFAKVGQEWTRRVTGAAQGRADFRSTITQRDLAISAPMTDAILREP